MLPVDRMAHFACRMLAAKSARCRSIARRSGRLPLAAQVSATSNSNARLRRYLRIDQAGMIEAPTMHAPHASVEPPLDQAALADGRRGEKNAKARMRRRYKVLLLSDREQMRLDGGFSRRRGGALAAGRRAPSSKRHRHTHTR